MCKIIHKANFFKMSILKKLALCGWFCTMFRLTISLSFLVDKIKEYLSKKSLNSYGIFVSKQLPNILREKLPHMKCFTEILNEKVKIALSRRFQAFLKMVIKPVRFKIFKNPFRGGFFDQNVKLKNFFFQKFWNAPELDHFEVEKLATSHG